MPDPSRLLQTRWATTLLRKQGNNWQATNNNRHSGLHLVSWQPKRNSTNLAPWPPRLRYRRYTASTQQNSLIFSEGDVPPLPFWTAAVSRQGFDGLTGEECLTAARRYCALAAQGVSTWKGKLGRGMLTCCSRICVALMCLQSWQTTALAHISCTPLDRC